MNRNERQFDSRIQTEPPVGISLSDPSLRYLSLKFAPMLLIMKGWDTKLEEDDGNPPKVSYTISRPVYDDFENIESLAERIGAIGEDGKVLGGYSIEIKPDETNINILKFNFSGFPTKQTLVIMDNLDSIFIPDHRALT